MSDQAAWLWCPCGDRQPRDRVHWEQKEQSARVRLGASGILSLDTGPWPRAVELWQHVKGPAEDQQVKALQQEGGQAKGHQKDPDS